MSNEILILRHCISTYLQFFYIDLFKLLEIVNGKLDLGGYKSIQGRESVEKSSGQGLSEITIEQWSFS